MTQLLTRPAFSVATKLISYAADLYEMDPWELVRSGRQRRKFYPRWAVIWTLRQLGAPGSQQNNPYSYPRLARLLGYGDHTSAIHGYNEIERMRRADPKLRELTDKMLAFARTMEPQVAVSEAA